MRGSKRIMALTAALAMAGAPPAAAALFAPDSYLNRPLPANAPLDPGSDLMVTALLAEVRAQRLIAGHEPTVNTTTCSPPVYTVPADQPTVAVQVVPPRLDSLPGQLSQVPIPPGAEPDLSCIDRSMVVHQPATDTLWELWRAARVGDTWQAVYGGKLGPDPTAAGTAMLGVSANPGYFQPPPLGFGNQFGASATSIPLIAGLQRIDELRSGVIDHAVGFVMARPAPCFRFPAQRQDGDALVESNPLAPPEGAILRLPAKLDIAALDLPPYVAMLARAVQRYGMVLRDRGGTTAFAAERPPPGGPDPYPEIFGGERPQTLLRQFPWEELQVLAVAPGHDPCQFRPTSS